uniref:ANK_REP_REGION domain-containing protein n=1 Tax=Setaria digitata TaxID=48799 RepID=A0A915PVB2_9BILA
MTLSRWHCRSYYTSLATTSCKFNPSCISNLEIDGQGDIPLLNIRSIPSTENLNQEFCRIPSLGPSRDEGFRPSNSQENSSNNHLSAIRSVITGDTTRLLHLIAMLKVSANAASSQGITLLHWAAINDNVDVARLLLSLGADFRLTTMKGHSVLHSAVYNGAANCLKLFLKIFLEPKSMILLGFIMKHLGWLVVEEMLQQRNKSNRTPVHVACLWKSVEVVNLLLTDNLDKIVAKTYNSKKRNVAIALRETSKRTLFWRIGRGTILHEMATMKCNFSCSTENLSSLKYGDELEALKVKMYLLDWCSTIETSTKRCPKCDEAQLKVVKIILRCCPELFVMRDVLGQTALMCAVIDGAVALTQAFLIYKSDKESVDPDFRTVLHHAAARGKLHEVRLLLECGASIKKQDSCGATPMHYAAIGGFCSTLELLYKASKYTDELRTNNGHNAFMWAAMNGTDISIRTMIDVSPGVSEEDCDKQGCNALHLAAAGDHIEVINTLLTHEWDAEKRNKLGETPLLVAVKNGSTRAVRRLLQAGVDCYTQDKFNNTALHLAADSDSKMESLRQLLNYSSDSSLINVQNNTGQTALHCAAEHNAVQNSSNVNCYSAADNQTTLSLALEVKNYILASFLEKSGAMLASEIEDIAARMCDRWYRAQSMSRCCRHAAKCLNLQGPVFSDHRSNECLTALHTVL